MKIKELISPADSFDIQFSEQPFDVVGFGLNSVDQLCVVGQYPAFNSKTEILEYKKLPGGQVATTLTFLSRMGLKTKYVGKVGGDEFGSYASKSLQAENIDTSSLLVEQGARNQHSFIIIEKKSGERTVLWQKEAALDFKDAELDQASICSGRILHLDGYDPSAVQCVRWCKERGILTSIDLDRAGPNCKELVQNADLLIVSSNFPQDYTGIADPIDSLLELNNSLSGFIVMTLGAGGAIAVIGNQCFKFRGLPVAALDTTGAGDVFHGGFIYGLLQNWPLDKIMAFSNAAAGLSCRYLGARTGIRPLPEIIQHTTGELMIPQVI
jgi:sulfofructose kinase